MTPPSLEFEYAHGKPTCTAIFRRSPEDFVVEEIYNNELTGEGEHFWLKIKKRGENTDWIAKKLANYFSVRTMDVGYGGKKDRHAVTTQWFSIYLPKTAHEIDWSAFIDMAKVDAELLASTSHKSKLKKGEHDANAFTISLHDVSDMSAVVAAIEKVKLKGVPNYFGEQRFGRDAGNLEKVVQWVSDPRSIRNKSLRGMVISAARSYLFNSVLSRRVLDGTWTNTLAGDVQENLPTGAMWGRGRSKVEAETAAVESDVLHPFSDWCSALENVGLNQERRPLVLKPIDLDWSVDATSLSLSMSLSSGEYATSVLRELTNLLHIRNDDKMQQQESA